MNGDTVCVMIIMLMMYWQGHHMCTVISLWYHSSNIDLETQAIKHQWGYSMCNDYNADEVLTGALYVHHHIMVVPSMSWVITWCGLEPSCWVRAWSWGFGMANSVWSHDHISSPKSLEPWCSLHWLAFVSPTNYYNKLWSKNLSTRRSCLSNLLLESLQRLWRLPMLRRLHPRRLDRRTQGQGLLPWLPTRWLNNHVQRMDCFKWLTLKWSIHANQQRSTTCLPLYSISQKPKKSLEHWRKPSIPSQSY